MDSILKVFISVYFPDKKTPNKRKRGSLSCESSPMTNTKNSGGGSRAVPLSERQQLAMIMRMSDESSQGKQMPKKQSLWSKFQKGSTPLLNP